MRSCRRDSLACQGVALAYQGEAGAARAAADASLEAAAELGGLFAASATRRWLSRPWPPAMCDGAGRERGGLAAPECRARDARRCARL